MTALSVLVPMLVRLADDPIPKDDDVVAGGWGAVVFVGLIVATVLLLISFTRQLKKTRQNAEQGAFGDAPAQPAESTERD